MATRPNWGKGRNLQIIIFEESSHATMITTVNDWLAALGEEEILDLKVDIAVYGSPAVEAYHVTILYSVE